MQRVSVKPKQLRTTLLPLIAALCTLGSMAARAIPEGQLAARYATEVQPFWQQQVSTGLLTTADGLQLPYAYVMPANPRMVIVLVQGRTEAFLKYQELFFDLATQQIAVFSLDHRGQGLSPRLLSDLHKGHIEQFSSYAQDQLQFVHDVVTPTAGALPLNLLAHSMGGAVAVQMRTRQPALFQRAVLTSPMIAPNAEVVMSERDGCYLATALGWTCPDCYAGFVAQPYPVAQSFVDNILTNSAVRYQQFRQLYQAQPALQLGGPTWQWLNEACLVADAMPALATQIRTPVLMLQSGAEQAVSNIAQETFCQQLGPYCAEGAVQRIDGAKHELLFETDQYREQALQKILQFLQSTP